MRASRGGTDSQAGYPKGVVRADPEDTGVGTVGEYAIIRGLEAESVEEVELQPSTEAEVGIRLRGTGERGPDDVQPRGDPGPYRQCRIRDCQRESDSHREV